MRYAKYIAALVVFMLAASCTINEFDEYISAADPKGEGGATPVEVYARITNYTDRTVDTRSAKLPEEAIVSSMALAVFPITTDAEGNPTGMGECIDYYYEKGQKVTFTIERTDDAYDDATDKPFAMYIFANMDNMPTRESGDWKTMTIEDFVAITHTVEETYFADAEFTGLPDTGFPMMGSLGDNVSGDTYGNLYADGKSLILKPTVTTENPHSLPLVSGTPADLLNIPMQSMYAKVSFNITINPIQTIDGRTQSFTLNSYTLHNIPSEVDFDLTTNDDSDVLASSPKIIDHSSTVEGGEGEGGIAFSFYIPERYLTPEQSAESYNYPFNSSDGLTAEQKQNLKQRYKPKLLGSEQKATYVTINGKYVDHNARTWDVDYNIYLGEDEYGNFDIVRNKHYNNNVVIRGVSNYADATDDNGSISIDHRVNITRSLPIIDNLRRETLLDAHFEVRPLRIKAVEGKSPNVTISVKDINGGSTPSWIRLEHNNGTGSATGDHLANGKRKYFTTDLVTATLKDNTSITIDPATDECIWIYVDECTDIFDSAATSGDTSEPVRSAKVVVEIEGEDTKLEYIINQSKLYKIPYPDNPSQYYLIESYEEYLYNYDAEDAFAANKTFYDGIEWGLDGVQLSNKHRAAVPTGLENYDRLSDANKTTLNNRVNSYYDFYITRYDSDIITPDPATDKHTRNGLEFCKEIVETAGIGELALDETPASAVEYCLNKNKRNSSGIVEDMVWYLPAIDEIEDVMDSAYNDFDGVFQAQDYWSSQPSYHRCYFFMSQSFGILWGRYTVAGNFDFYVDDVTRARSTRATFKGEYDSEGNPKFSHNPSGVEIPYEDVENKVYPTEERPGNGGANVNFYIQKGYYRWVTNRGGTYAPDVNADGVIEEDEVKTNYSTTPPSDTYDHAAAYINSHPVWPEFGEGEYREDGSKLRTEKHRVRCLRAH